MEPQSKDAPTSAAGGLSPVVRACNEVRRLPSTLPPLIEYVRSLSEPTEIVRLERLSFDAEVLWRARCLGDCVVEVPIVWRDDPRSHVRLLRDSGGMLLDLGRVRVNARAGRCGLDRGPAPDRARWMGKERSQTPLHDE